MLLAAYSVSPSIQRKTFCIWVRVSRDIQPVPPVAATLPQSALRQIHGCGNQLPRREQLRGSHRCLTPRNQVPGDSGKSSPLAKITLLIRK
jgi:hypothetical protein